MHAKKYLFLTFLQWLLFTLLKVWIFNNQIFSDPAWQNWMYWALTGILFVAILRRFGIITYFEALFCIFTWFVIDLFLDLIVTSNFTGLGIFAKPEFWFGYVIMALSAFIFHKKRHVQIRKEQHAHHGHGHGGHSDYHEHKSLPPGHH